MKRDEQQYFSTSPDAKLKICSISESLRKKLYFFKTISGVFSFKKIDLGTKILIKYLIIPKNKSILWDLGCGYGVIGIVLAKESPNSEIYFTDINPRAIWSTRENIKLNFPEKSNRFHVLQGSYFKPFKTNLVKFDAIYCNPPLKAGKKDFLKVIKRIPQFLEPDGFFEFVIKRSLGAKAIYEEIGRRYPNFSIIIIAKKSGYWLFRLSI